MAASISYFIILELMVGNLPPGIRMYTVAHPLRKMIVTAVPTGTRLYQFDGALLERIYPAGETGIPELTAIVAITLALTCVAMTFRELTPSKASRE